MRVATLLARAVPGRVIPGNKRPYDPAGKWLFQRATFSRTIWQSITRAVSLLQITCTEETLSTPRRRDMVRLPRFTWGILPQQPAELASGAPRLHYAWVIVTVAALICMITSPVRFAISMLVPYLQSPEGFGWSYFAISIAFALQWLTTALISPLVGWLGDRYGVRRTMLLGAGLFIVSMLLTGSMTRLWHFYLYFGILLAVPLTIYQVPLIDVVAVWFWLHLGVAMGILQATQGLGTVVAIPLISVLFAHFGL